MNTKHVIIMLGAVLLLISVILPFASALTDSDADYLIKQYSVYDIKRTCIYNSSWCSLAAECNLTINFIQGNGSIIYSNALMTNQGSFHNLTLKPADTSQPGWYQAYMTCTDLGDSGYESFYYRVTQTGDESNTNIFIIIGVAFILIIAFGYLIRNEYVVFIGGTTALILGIYSMVYGFGSTQNNFTYMLSVVIICIGMIFTLMPAYQLLENNGETGYELVEEVSSE